SPDPTYNVNLSILCYDKDRKPIGEVPEAVSVWSGYAPDLGNSLVGDSLFSPEFWHYLTKKLPLPAQTRSVKIRFGFRHSYHGSDVTTRGDAWLDDVNLTSAQVMTTDNSGEPYREHAWPVWDNRNMRIHTPAFMNLFLPGDKLTVDVTVLSNAEALKDQSDVTLEYRVEDFFHMVLLEERAQAPGFTPVPEQRLKAARVDPKLFGGASWRQIVLPPSLSATEAGRWFRFHCRVLKKGETIAEGNSDFGIVRPAVPASEAKKEFSKFAAELSLFSPAWGACPPAEGLAPRPAVYADLFGFHWKRGSYINNWAGVQPARDGPMNWNQCEVESLVRRGVLQSNVNNRIYLCFNSVLPGCRPAWANLPGEPASRDSLDPQAFAPWIHAVVDRYKGMGIMWMPGFSETEINEKQANLGRVGYEAAKQADPDAVVFCNGVTGMSVERMKQWFALGHLDFTDALDLHFYYDPYATEETLDYVQAEMKRQGKVKPIWSAEIGSFCPDSETLCKDMVKKHVIAFACGMRNVSWHSFGSPETRRMNTMWHFYYRYPEGKLASAFPTNAPVPGSYNVPLPRLFTLNNLLRDLDYVVPRNKFVAADGVRVYAFDRETPINPDADKKAGLWSHLMRMLSLSGRDATKETVVCLWQHTPGARPKGKNVALTTDRPVTVRDAFGLKHELAPDAAGRIHLPANDNPLLLNVAGFLEKVEIGDGLLSIAGPETLNGVQPFDVTVTVVGRGGRPLKGSVKLQAGLGWRVEPAASEVRVADGQSETLTFTLTPPAAMTPGKHRLLVQFTNPKGTLTGYDEFYILSGR
ncbi:MAG: hypothetical protein PHR35_16955, partial [Kiritimatiellae bacterium]|nr:hypothetical protein [Kiritimatiellia bacterium]